MKISIITVNLNKGDVFERTIQSVLSQTYQFIEFIIIDGGSSDDSIEILKKYDRNINFWLSEKDDGIYHAMNKGITNATGDYLLFLNSGDYLAGKYVIQNTLEKINRIDSSDHSIIFYGNIIVENKIIPATKNIDLGFFCSASLPHPASFISNKIFDRIGVYDENYRIISDWIFFLKAYLSQVKFIYIEQTITVFELNGISSNLQDSEIEREDFLLKNYPNLSEDFKVLSELKIYKLSRIHQTLEYFRSLYKSIFK